MSHRDLFVESLMLSVAKPMTCESMSLTVMPSFELPFKSSSSLSIALLLLSSYSLYDEVLLELLLELALRSLLSLLDVLEC